MRKTISLIFILLLVAGCGNDHKQESFKRQKIGGVVTSTVQVQGVTEFYEITGTVRARNSATVSGRIMGEVKDVRVRLGDRVAEGQILLVIDSPDIKARAGEAEEALETARIGLEMAERKRRLAEKTYSRYERLFKERAISRQEFDEISTERDMAVLEVHRAERALRQAEEAVREAEAVEGYTIIRAPFSGVIAEKHIEVGDMVSPGMPLFSLEDDHYTVEVPVDEGLAKRVKRGMNVEVTVPAAGLKMMAPVSEVAPQVSAHTRTFRVKIDLGSGVKGISGGMYAVVRIPYGGRETIMIPEGALLRRGELRGVYVVDQEGIVSMRLVRTGKERDGMVEILSGLAPGERIVIEGIERVVDGAMITLEGGEG